MLLKDIIKAGTAALEGIYGPGEAKSIVLMLTGDILGTQRWTHLTEPSTEVPAEKQPLLESALERLRSGEPVQYVLGKAEFAGRTFRVGPGVLIPRPETEYLAMAALRLAEGREKLRVLDLYTGSGCLAWTLALGHPGAEVVGVDISEKALEIARGQDFASETGASGAIAPNFVRSDLLDFDSVFAEGKFDLILSNPPYIMEKEKPLMRINVLGFEPPEALFVPDDDPLVHYRAVAGWSRRLLAPQGAGLSEINDRLGEETLAVFRAAGFKNAEFLPDSEYQFRHILY